MSTNFTDRMQGILQAAEEEAAEIRNRARAARRAEEESAKGIIAAARADADAILTQARTDAESPLEEARSRAISLQPDWFTEKDNPNVHHYWDGSAWHPKSWRAPNLVFVSYARVDSAIVKKIVSDLRSAHLEIWLDEELTTGQEWWKEILHRINSASVFIPALSDSSLRSEACRAERTYADALNLPVVPVQVSPADLRISPYGRRQIVDYREADRDSTARLIADVMRATGQRLPPTGTPPTPPLPPFAYLLELATALDAIELSRGEQTKILHEIIDHLDDVSETSVRANLLSLVRRLTRRADAARTTVSLGERILASMDVDGTLT